MTEREQPPCYTDDAVFEDPAFGRLEDGAVKDMWRMLCERSDDLEVVLIEHGADGDAGWAHWSATYTFTGTGRPVVNDIRSRFRFDGELVRDQVDTFSLRRWGAQALGSRGTLLGHGRPARPRRPQAGPREPRALSELTAQRPVDRDVADVRLGRDRARGAIVLHDAVDVDLADVGVGVDGVGGVRQAELDVADVGERLEAVRGGRSGRRRRHRRRS